MTAASRAASYVVVGGGISGLTAAFRLRAAAGDAARITLLDPGDRLGGTLRTVRLAGRPFEVGAEAFIARRPEVPALLADLGMADQVLGTTGARPLVYAAGALHPLPSGTLNGIPSSAQSLTGLVDDTTLAWMEAEPTRPLRWQSGADPSVAELVGDRFGAQVVARAVDPMLGGVYAGSAATIGLRSAAPGLAKALDDGAESLTDAVRAALPPSSGAPIFGAVRGGYDRLIGELARRSRADRVTAAVTALGSSDGGFELRATEGDAWRADAVVLAVPAAQLPALLAGVAPTSAAAAARIPIASSVVVALGVRSPAAFPQQSGVLVASGERLHAKAITLSTRKWGGDPGGPELLRCSFGRFGEDITDRAGDDEFLAWAVEDVATVFGMRVDVIDACVQRWPDALPQYAPDHAALAAEIRGGLPDGLALAGNYLDGIGVPACIAAATAAVARLVAR